LPARICCGIALPRACFKNGFCGSGWHPSAAAAASMAAPGGTAETVPFPNSFLKQDVEIRKCTPDAYNHETSSGFAWAKPSAERARKINDDQCCQVPIYWPYLPASQRAISSRSCL